MITPQNIRRQAAELEEELRLLKIEQLSRLELKTQLMESLKGNQKKVFKSKARRKSLTCGRRSGKSFLAARLILLSLVDAPRGVDVGYAAIDKGQARKIIWGELEGLFKELRLESRGWKMNNSTLSIETPLGAHFYVFGFANKKEFEKFRGLKFALFICDEPATYEPLLGREFWQAIKACFADYAGTLIFMGTPGPVRFGNWYEISVLDQESALSLTFERWHWTVRDNPGFPRDPEEYIAEEIRDAGAMGEDDPQIQREIFAQWSEDEGALVYAFKRTKKVGKQEVPWNTTLALPDDYDRHTWVTTMGIDYGFTAPSAWSILTSHPNRPEIYTVYAEKQTDLTDDDIADRTMELIKEYKVQRVVGDGADPKAIATFNRRHGHAAGFHIEKADKLGKLSHIAMMNTELKTGRMKHVVGSADEVINEQAVLVWKDNRHKEEDKRSPNHASDATLYAFMKHRAYLHVEPVAPKPIVDPLKFIVDDVEEERAKRYKDAAKRAAKIKRR